MLRFFLSSLADSGRVVVDEPTAAMGGSADDVDDMLATYDLAAREGLGHEPPTFLPDVARWAAEWLYAACQCLVYRRLDETAVRRSLGVACPRPLSAGTLYSADLLLRYLVDLTPMARAVAEHDVLVSELQRIAAAWPLSSVGMPDVAAPLDARSLEIIMGDQSLRQLYIDRVIAHRDGCRLKYPDVREGVREALGYYEELWPAMVLTAPAMPVEWPRIYGAKRSSRTSLT